MDDTGSSEISFTVEEFHSFEGDSRVPHGEMLFKHKTSTEDFFAAVRKNPEDIIPTDLKIFEKAIAEHLRLGHSVSINLNAETFSDDRLLSTLEKLMNEHPKLDPNKIWLEITEQGGIPENFDGTRLALLKGLGFTLALDDFDPTQEIEWARLDIFSPYLSAIKLPFKIMDEIRSNDILTAERLIQKIQAAHPEKILVIEGHKGKDSEFNDFLKKAGVDVIQKSSYVDPKIPLETKPLAPTP